MRFFFRNAARKHCNVYPLTIFVNVKLGYKEVYLFLLFLIVNIDCGYTLEPPRRGGSNEYPQFMYSKNKKIIIQPLHEKTSDLLF